ncbi:hypothetical protein MXD62_01995 [Frankia sp. Mgl5]|uniref:hypothetical protein n=1 Tax=Frankia sp. Mgl5 TaxID=2933793 RepID=UPI00200E5ECB|nr:hypothetical protein [Frankia sp. Mgl5]MCK9925943.1 hypothetical protein [Frankia sp. Mgl5]
MPGDEAKYILITQCVQNDFLFNLNCRLRLPDDAVGKLFLPSGRGGFEQRGNRRTIDDRTIRRSPFGRLLAATAGERLRGRGEGELHLVNVRDWHVPSDEYDLERRGYGPHCEAGTWGADYPSALTGLLDPTGTRRRSAHPEPTRGRWSSDGSRSGSLVVHHIHSNSLFDLNDHASGEHSELMDTLKPIIESAGADNVRIAVVGVYTDIKVQILLQSLRVAFAPKHLVVSDSLTASVTLDRHLAALDFAHKVLRVEVMHGVSDLAHFLGSDEDPEEEPASAMAAIAFADYAQYFRDRQSIVSYEETMLRGYRQQMAGRLRTTVRLVNFTNTFLIACGILTLGSSVTLAVISSLRPDSVPLLVPMLVLGLSAVQLVSSFFRRPAVSLAQMLSNEAVFRILLESRSLRLALARYHFTAPNALHPDGDSAARTELVRQQLDMLANLDRVDFDRFETLGSQDRDPGTR